MKVFGRGWRRFRRLPLPAQVAAWLGLVAMYSAGLVVLIGGGDVAAPGGQQAAPRPLTPLERRVKAAVEAVDPKATEQNDVQRFRKPIARSIRCPSDRTCEVTYAVGLPGRGRIVEDQRLMIERIYRRTGVRKLRIEVVRDTAAAGVPPKAGEETPSGTPMIATLCDATKRKDVDWSKRSGAQILQNICDVGAYDQGDLHRQDPVAPDDPVADDAVVPPDGG